MIVRGTLAPELKKHPHSPVRNRPTGVTMGTLVQLGSPSTEVTSSPSKQPRLEKKSQRLEAFSLLANKSLHGCYSEKVADILQSHSYNFVLSDPHLPDNPVSFRLDFLVCLFYPIRPGLQHGNGFLQLQPNSYNQAASLLT